MSTSKTWPGGAVNVSPATYSIPSAGELNWQNLSLFLNALGDSAQATTFQKYAVRLATSSPVTVSSASDCVIACKLSVAGAVAVTLPAGANKQVFIIGDSQGDASTNNITITPNGAETINGAANLVINHNYSYVTLIYNSSDTDWKVTNQSLVPGSITPSDITGVIPASKGGTGVANNDSATLTRSGNHNLTLTTTGASNVTVPTTGTLATLAGSETFTNKSMSGSANTFTNISLTASVTGTLPIGNGGTGQTSANAALNALLPAQTGNAGKVLQTDATNTSWQTAATVPSTAGWVYSNATALASLAFASNGNKVAGINSAGNDAELKSFAVGTSGSDFAVANGVGTITFNLPDAGAAARGAVTTGSQTMAGLKTFTSGVQLGSAAGSYTPSTISHYQEGTFTPIIDSTGGSSTPTYTAQVGTYTRIGRMVYYQVYLRWSGASGSPTGNLLIRDLPYTSANTTGRITASGCVLIENITLTAGYTYVVAYVAANTTFITLEQCGSGVVDAAIPVTNNLTGGSFSKSFMVSGFYFI